jgi:hypothetical protein
MWKSDNPEEEYQGWLDKNDEGNPENEVWREGKKERARVWRVGEADRGNRKSIVLLPFIIFQARNNNNNYSSTGQKLLDRLAEIVVGHYLNG